MLSMSMDSVSPDRRDASRPFPVRTVAAAAALLLLFGGLVAEFFGPTAASRRSQTDADAKSRETKDAIDSRNRAIMNGTDSTVKMSAEKAESELLSHARQTSDATNRHGRLPFPIQPKAEAKAP
jgi:hypothetical protein